MFRPKWTDVICIWQCLSIYESLYLLYRSLLDSFVRGIGDTCGYHMMFYHVVRCIQRKLRGSFARSVPVSFRNRQYQSPQRYRSRKLFIAPALAPLASNNVDEDCGAL